MTVALPKKVPRRVEYTGNASQDRAQRMAQSVGTAHEQTKAVVAPLANSAYVALAADTTTASATFVTLLTSTITTILASGFLDVTFTASGLHITNLGTVSFRLVVDGVTKKGCYTTVPSAGYAFTAAITQRVAVTAGAHTVLVQWSTGAATAQINAASTVQEHAHLLMRESP